ncbi:MAG TPA: hypothetical protein VKA60_10950 [Blastocatellia bacterium]|nr:hypothetical protein [Blastocatellia bacterium]
MPPLVETTCTVLLLLALGLPQQKADTQSRTPADREATERKALVLLDQLSDDAGSFADGELKVRIQSQVANMLWRYDEPRARRQFEAAFQAIASTSLPPQDKSVPPSYVGADSHYPLRNDVIRMVAERDPTFAAKLVDSVIDLPPNVDPKFHGYTSYSESDMLRFQFALYITTTDPQRAAQIARAFLQKGDTHRAVTIARSLRGKDATLADALFAGALSQVKQRHALSTENVRELAMYLFPDFGEGVILFTSGSGNRNRAELTRASPALMAQFFDLAGDAVTEWTAEPQTTAGADARGGVRAPVDYTIAKLLLPYFDRYAPDKSAALRARLDAALRRPMTGDERRLADSRAGTVQELLSRAQAATDGREKDRLYLMAAMQAARSHDLSEAPAILGKISDERTRAQADSFLRYAAEDKRRQEAQSAMDSADWETADRLIHEMTDKLNRFYMLSNLAVALSSHGEKARALSVLDEAGQLSGTIEDGIQRAEAMVHLASLSVRLDPRRGFDDMRLAVAAINRAGFAPQWQKIETITDEKSGTTRRVQVGLEALSSGLLNSSLSLLGAYDFDRALALTKEIEMKEVRALAQLAICRGALRPAQ